jgi:ribosomal protein S9
MATTTRYIEAIGRRKTATTRVRLTPAKETSSHREQPSTR